MKNILKLSALAFVSVVAVACHDPESNTEDDRYIDVPNKDYEPVVQKGVIKRDNKFIEWAKAFPGLVPDSVYRYVDGEYVDGRYTDPATTVKIDLNYIPTSGSWRHSHYGSSQKPIFSTGFYAPPAEQITVYRQSGAPNVKVQIGWSDNISVTDKNGKPQKMLRYPEINEGASFKDGVDSLVLFNDFGGTIFIQPLTATAGLGEWEYTFKGVVKPANFVKGVDDVSQQTINDWFARLDTVQVPMIEIIGDYHVWHMPVADARAAKNAGGLRPDNIKQLVEWYDDAILHDYYDYVGAEYGENYDPNSVHRAPTFKIRDMAELQISVGAAHSGYPAKYGGSSYSTRGMQLDLMESGNAWGFFHELGHNFQQPNVWSWGAFNGGDAVGGDGEELHPDGTTGINEVSNNFHIFHHATRVRQDWMDDAGSFKTAAEKFAAAPDDGYKNFGLTEDDVNFTILAEYINADKARITPFMQLAQRYGWRLFAYLCRSGRELSQADYDKLRSGSPALDGASRRKAFFMLRCCEWAQTDLTPFFIDWGFKPNPALRAEMGKMPNKLDRENDPWWHTFDYTKMPSFENKDASEIVVKLSNEPVWTAFSGDLKRDNWKVIETAPLTADKDTGNKPEHLLDGDGATFTSMARPGKGNNTAGGGVNPFFVVDLGKVESINYMLYQHRTNLTAAGLRVWNIKVEGSLDGQAWEVIKEDIAINKTDNELQKLKFGKDVAAQFVKVTYIEWDRGSSSTGLQQSEFGLGFDE